jgi:apolipoprotein N-acyltransferase
VKLTGLIQEIMLAWGWRRWLIAFVAGALSALAMAPFDAWPVLFVTFPALVWLIDSAAQGSWRGVIAAAAAGWWFGFGYFVAGLYWIGYAFLVDAPAFAWMLPFAVIGLPMLLALFTGFGAALARLLWTRGVERILALAVALTATEWLRGQVLTGFPWNAFGYALTAPTFLAQSASLIGLWGLTFLAVVIFASPATLGDDRSEMRRPWLPLAISVAVLGGISGWGALRLMRHPTQFVDKVHLRLMQPNLQQDIRFNYAARQEIINRYVTLSQNSQDAQAAGLGNVTHLIWPESPFPFFLTREPEAFEQITKLLPANTVLITGAMRVAEPLNPSDPRAYNSIYVLSHDGSILALYDKLHLVPFGEYLPFERLLTDLHVQELTKQRGGFLPGDRRRLIMTPGAPPALPLICYEIIFPNEIVPAGERPGWMVNVTNDGWFGISTGPYQHFQQARVRAIEEGLPLVRVANTGISAVVDPVGRVVDSIPLGTEGVIDARLPRAVPLTLYGRLGDAPAAIIVAIAFAFVVRRRARAISVKN